MIIIQNLKKKPGDPFFLYLSLRNISTYYLVWFLHALFDWNQSESFKDMVSFVSIAAEFEFSVGNTSHLTTRLYNRWLFLLCSAPNTVEIFEYLGKLNLSKIQSSFIE